VPRKIGVLPTIYLAHGASGNAVSMGPHVAGLEKRGLEAHAVQLPVSLAEKAVPRYREQVPDLARAIIGGQSYGGRVATLLAAEETPLGLVLMCFPLHRPGQPDGTARAGHFARIKCPVLLLSGEADPFARIDLLRAAIEKLPDARLVTYPRLGHSLRAVLDDTLDRVAEFARSLS
jgi:predicted alpha/beta-hydrolase family hydrolase